MTLDLNRAGKLAERWWPVLACALLLFTPFWPFVVAAIIIICLIGLYIYLKKL